MENLIKSNKKCLFLNHKTLINSIYKENVARGSRYYQLKKEIFNFQEKPVKEAKQHDANPEAAAGKRRKRKPSRNRDDDEANLILSKQEVATIQSFLEEIGKKEIHKDLLDVVDMPRYWEECQQFPKFKGLNATQEFQYFPLHSRNYLIPPNSQFYNYDVKLLVDLLPELPSFDLIVMDPPWRNKYIRRLKKTKMDLGYQMLYNCEIANLPIKDLIHSNSIVAIWCTNSLQHQKAIESEILPKWNLKLLHKLKWFKLNTKGSLISEVNQENKKQPYEELFLAISQDSANGFADLLKETEMIFSIPSIIHSHKPPLQSWLASVLSSEPKILEIFARYLYPGCTSIGLEVLKLMDQRLYEEFL